MDRTPPLPGLKFYKLGLYIFSAQIIYNYLDRSIVDLIRVDYLKIIYFKRATYF